MGWVGREVDILAIAIDMYAIRYFIYIWEGSGLLCLL